MSRFKILRNMMLRHRTQLLITYLLFALEMVGTLLRPFFLGMAVNDLLRGSYHGLILLCSVHLAYMIAGTVRHMYDTRTYSAIYTSLVTQLLSRRFARSEISKLSAHSTLAREFVDFLEYDLIYVLEAASNIIGSLLLLFFYDLSVVGICFAALLPVVSISYFYGRKMKKLNRMKNDELEHQVDVITSGDVKAIRYHYNNLRKWQIKISDKEAWNFGLMELMVMLVIGIALLETAHKSGTALLAGDVVGIYAYILKFVSGLDTIPYMVQRLSSLTDITRRMELQEEDFPSTVTVAQPPLRPVLGSKIKEELY